MSGAFSWRGRRVLVTGHTGFKGAWLCQWLHQAGATVAGYALAPEGARSLYEILGLASSIDSELADVRDLVSLERSMKRFRPELVFHLAAQALVPEGYREPAQTFETNLNGTVNVLEAIRRNEAVTGAVIVTTDKCYEPRADGVPFREEDRLGGHDPYSASKAGAELATAAYRASFFADGPIVATARAGNVLGGGDWSKERLVPDVVRAAEARRPVVLRYPQAVRPWQHVFDPLHGYLLLGARALGGDHKVGSAWNFGPAASDVATVRDLVDRLHQRLPSTYGIDVEQTAQPYENPSLLLDAGKARRELGWQPRYDVEEAIEITASWYGAFLGGQDLRAFSLKQLEDYARLD